MIMKIVNKKNFFMIKRSKPWHNTYYKNLHYKSFSFTPFNVVLIIKRLVPATTKEKQ